MRMLDLSSDSTEVKKVTDDIRKRLVGQDGIVNGFGRLLELSASGLAASGKPIGSMLILGPTGLGKTYSGECLGYALYGGKTPNIVRVDCAEFQHSHEIARLIGSPPGYLGHRETHPFFTNTKLATMAAQSGQWPFGIIQFDEIEKANDSLWNLLLGILDKATLTLGTNEVVNFEKTIILMTSNVGSEDMQSAINGKLGFAGAKSANDEEIAAIGIAAAKKKFTPEFINRLDILVAGRTLTEAENMEVLNREIIALWREIFMSSLPVRFNVTDAAKDGLMKEGYDPKYNARHIKRAVDKFVRMPLARAISGQHVPDPTEEMIVVDYVDGKFVYGVEKA